MPREFPRYRALEKLSIRPVHDCEARLVFAGETFYFDGAPGNSLRPLNGSARQAKLRALKAIVAGRASGGATDTVACIARGLGYEGHDEAAAAAFIDDFIKIETSRQTAAPSTKGKLP
jgi:hypothetical protein